MKKEGIRLEVVKRRVGHGSTKKTELHNHGKTYRDN